MENRFGFIRDKLDIKILILYLLARLKEPVSFDRLYDLVLCDDGISYFDYTDSLEELIQTDHVTFDGNEYSITEKGRINGEIIETGIPYSVRIKAGKKAAVHNAETARLSNIRTDINLRRGGGYEVYLSLSDGTVEIANLMLYADNEKQARMLEEGFLKNAEDAYQSIISSLLKE